MDILGRVIIDVVSLDLVLSGAEAVPSRVVYIKKESDVFYLLHTKRR